MSEPKWLLEARKYLGTKEIPGAKHNDVIVKWYADSGNRQIKDDETAWCAAFTGAMLKAVGLKGTNSLAARSYLNWGTKLDKPKVGAITVFKRGNSTWQGHVAFFLRDLGDRIEVLGGNQGNKVSITTYSKKSLLGYRWPDTIQKSGVIKGSTVALTGGSTILADQGTDLVYQLTDANEKMSYGTLLGTVIAVFIIGGAAWAIYKRWDAGGREGPEWIGKALSWVGL